MTKAQAIKQIDRMYGQADMRAFIAGVMAQVLSDAPALKLPRLTRRAAPKATGGCKTSKAIRRAENRG